MQEKRRFIRLDSEFEVVFRLIDADHDQILTALTRNVSGGGLALLTEQKLKVGTALALDLELKGRSERLHFTAAVVWSDPILKDGLELDSQFESGLRFMEIKPEDKEFIIQKASEA